MPEIQSRSRNVSRHLHSLRLPLASGNSCLDFAAEVKDGHGPMVECKGQQHADEQETPAPSASSDSSGKPRVRGRGVFVLAIMKKGATGRIRQRVRDALT